MNKEIKGILEELEIEYPNTIDKIKRYITNLQNELYLEKEMFNNYLKEQLDYKIIVNKTIEYIKKNYFEEVYKTKGTMLNDLLKILGGDE